MTAAFVRERIGEAQFLAELREQLKSRGFRPVPAGQGMDDPQAGVAQAAASGDSDGHGIVTRRPRPAAYSWTWHPLGTSPGTTTTT